MAETLAAVLSDKAIPGNGKWVRVPFIEGTRRRVRYMTRLRSGIVGVESVDETGEDGYICFGIGGYSKTPMPLEAAMRLSLKKASVYLESCRKQAERMAAAESMAVLPYYETEAEARAAGELNPKDDLERRLVDGGWQPRWQLGRAENRLWFDASATRRLYTKKQALQIERFRQGGLFLSGRGWSQTTGNKWFKLPEGSGEVVMEPITMARALEIEEKK